MCITSFLGLFFDKFPNYQDGSILVSTTFHSTLTHLIFLPTLSEGMEKNNKLVDKQ